MLRFAEAASRLGFPAVEINYVIPPEGVQEILTSNHVSVVSLHSPTPRVRAGDRWSDALNLAALDEEERAQAVRLACTTIDYAAQVGARYIAAYTASKHGVLGLTRALAIEFVPYNITVNAICPGYVDTPMTEQGIALIVAKTGMSPDQARQSLASTSPQQRLIEPEEVATVALMLAGESAKGITGQAINVDGGAVMF
jgi:NAD(P)-dependent dehydrogenase (short-subunit alcohol dehydrogenase family)